MTEGRGPQEGFSDTATSIVREVKIVVAQERIVSDVFSGLKVELARIDRVIGVGMPGTVKLLMENDPVIEDFDITDPEELFAQRPRARVSFVYNVAPQGEGVPTPISPKVPVIVEEMITAEADDRDMLSLYHAGRDTEGVMHKDFDTMIELQGEHQWKRAMLVRRLTKGLLLKHPPR